MTGRTLVLGGGFGGISAALELKRLLGDGHEVVLVDRKPEFRMGLRKLWALVGIATVEDGSRPRTAPRAPRRQCRRGGDHAGSTRSAAGQWRPRAARSTATRS